jgi:hypothetical protein
MFLKTYDALLSLGSLNNMIPETSDAYAVDKLSSNLIAVHSIENWSP